VSTSPFLLLNSLNSRLQSYVDHMFTEAEVSITKGSPGAAREIALSVMSDSAATGLTLPNISRLCRIFYEAGDPRLSLSVADAAFAAVEKVACQGVNKPGVELAKLDLVKGMCEEFFDHNMDAVKSYRRAIRGFRQTTEDASPAIATYRTESRARLGQVLTSLGNYAQAEHELRAALAATHDDDGTLNSRLRLKICAMLANVLSIMEVYDYADKYFSRALAGLQEEGMWIDMAMASIDHSHHILRCHEKIRPHRVLAQHASSPGQVLTSALKDAVQSSRYLETLRLSFPAAPDRKKWELFTSDGWSAAFNIADLLTAANTIGELVETRLNATQHGIPHRASPSSSHATPLFQAQQSSTKHTNFLMSAGSSPLVAGAYLPANEPGPLLMPSIKNAASSIALYEFEDMNPYPSRVPRMPVRTW
jgi:tetratricopeptide (TPR) repeat protein